jgi:hypothetical protein
MNPAEPVTNAVRDIEDTFEFCLKQSAVNQCQTPDTAEGSFYFDF